MPTSSQSAADTFEATFVGADDIRGAVVSTRSLALDRLQWLQSFCRGCSSMTQ
jgi:hypothetical protein